MEFGFFLLLFLWWKWILTWLKIFHGFISDARFPKNSDRKSYAEKENSFFFFYIDISFHLLLYIGATDTSTIRHKNFLRYNHDQEPTSIHHVFKTNKIIKQSQSSWMNRVFPFGRHTECRKSHPAFSLNTVSEGLIIFLAASSQFTRVTRQSKWWTERPFRPRSFSDSEAAAGPNIRERQEQRFERKTSTEGNSLYSEINEDGVLGVINKVWVL